MIGSLFSGVGGLELGLERAGLGPVAWQVELDPFCRGQLARHWPNVKRYEDVRTVGASNLPYVDLICGGFPCQDVSSAGKGAGLAGSRSGLWFEFARILWEMRPEWVVVENVASGATRWLDTVVAGLEQQGWTCLPIPLSARDVGAPHRRERIFVVGHTDRTGCQRPGQTQSEGRLCGLEPFRPSAGVPDPERDELRQQPGRGGGSDWQGSGEPGNLGAQRASADTASDRREAEGQRTESGYLDWQCELRHGIETGRIPEPALRGVVDGLSSMVGRRSSVASLRRAGAGRHRRQELKALGNAVVPQCAEVIGHIIQMLRGQ